MSINILDSATAMKIAAGEVIDRPASAVRELLDNALDAGATWISIDVEKGGKEYLSVVDNGIGMDENDLKKCYFNHATSKISQFDDLMQLKTFGFRGEALASLAEISSLKIASKTQSNDYGAELSILFGKEQNFVPKGMNQGTSIVITEFFQNVPARLKFLNSDVSEYRAIVQEVLKKALAKPEVSFELSHNGEKKYQLNNATELFQRINDIYPELINILQPFIYEDHGIQVYGFMSEPSWYKSTRNYQYLFVNGRMIEWQAFKQQISLVYQQILPPAKFPAVFCYVEINTEKIDFNVHPQKKEIRFENESLVSSIVRRALKQGLVGYVKPINESLAVHDSTYVVPSNSSINNSSNYSNNSTKLFTHSPVFNYKQTNIPNLEQLQVLFQQSSNNIPDLLLKRYVGTIFHTYLLFEGENILYLADFHAMHERIRYERLLAYYKEQVPSQQIIPFVFVVSKIEAELFEKIELSLSQLGFKLHPINENSFSVDSIPTILGIGEAKQVLQELFVEDLTIHDSYHWDTVCKTIACKGSTRAGDVLTVNEVTHLVGEWLQCENPHSCPHGRPIVVTMNKGFFDKEFKRTGF